MPAIVSFLASADFEVYNHLTMLKNTILYHASLSGVNDGVNIN